MEIIEVNINNIKEYENNPRHNDEAVELVANSIKEFGFKVPVVIDKNNTIVAGHTRVKAAKMLGMESVPCIRADDLTDEQVKAFRLADNKVQEASGWDFSKLEEELDGIFDIDMSDFGFGNIDPVDVDAMFEDAKKSNDADKEEKTETITCPFCGKTFER